MVTLIFRVHVSSSAKNFASISGETLPLWSMTTTRCAVWPTVRPGCRSPYFRSRTVTDRLESPRAMVPMKCRSSAFQSTLVDTLFRIMAQMSAGVCPQPLDWLSASRTARSTMPRSSFSIFSRSASGTSSHTWCSSIEPPSWPPAPPGLPGPLPFPVALPLPPCPSASPSPEPSASEGWPSPCPWPPLPSGSPWAR